MAFASHKADTFVIRANVVYFVEIPLCFIKDTLNSTKDASTRHEFIFSKCHKYGNWEGEGEF